MNITPNFIEAFERTAEKKAEIAALRQYWKNNPETHISEAFEGLKDMYIAQQKPEIRRRFAQVLERTLGIPSHHFVWERGCGCIED